MKYIRPGLFPFGPFHSFHSISIQNFHLGPIPFHSTLGLPFSFHLSFSIPFPSFYYSIRVIPFICHFLPFTQAKLLIKGNFINNGLITETNNNTWSLTELGGSSSSTFSTVENGITNDVSLKINKSSNASVMALSDITLPNSISAFLTISNGNLDMLTNNKTLFVQNPIHAAVLGGYASSHIIGKLKGGPTEASCCYDFPLSNNATQMAKVNLSGPAVQMKQWTVDFLPVNPNAFNGLTPKNHWQGLPITHGILPDRGNTIQCRFSFRLLWRLNTTSAGAACPGKVVQWNGSLWNGLGELKYSRLHKSTLGSAGDCTWRPKYQFQEFCSWWCNRCYPDKYRISERRKKQ